MAGMAIDQREPDVARYIDSYKFEENQAYRRDKFGGGTSLPLNSDGYEDKQQKLRNERHDDWMQQQDKPKESVYYRVGTPEQGFPGLGSYENQRKQQNYARQQEYNDLLSKQREMEQKKYEQRRHARAQPPAQPQQPQMDYNLSQEQARAEEKRSYQDYMGKYQHPNNFPQKPPINYEENKRVLNEERKREYNLLMEKKTKEERYWQNRGKPATPPGGLNIGNYDRQLKEQAAQKKKDYKEMLDKQKSEQMRLRAYDHMAETSPAHVKYLQEERPLVGSPRDINYALQERDARDKFGKGLGRRPRSDNVPPQPSNQYSHIDDDPQIKAYLEVEKDKLENKRRYAEELLQQQREHMYLRARQEPEVAVLDRSGPQQQYVPSKPPAGPGYRPKDDPTRQTPRYWNEGKLSRGPPSQDSDAPASRQSSKNGTPLSQERRHDEQARHPGGKPAEVVKNQYYSSEDYERFQRDLQKQQNDEYKDFLSKKDHQHKNRDWNYQNEGVLELRGDDAQQSRQKELKKERQKEYNDYISQQKMMNPSRRTDFSEPQQGPFNGLFHGLGEHGNNREALNEERRREYNDKLNQNQVERSPVRSPLRNPGPQDHYQQMLDEKRREEASRRRYDDPEYQDRLAQGSRDAPRYGY